MANEITTGYVIEYLSKPEVMKLKRMILGYGNFKKIAANSGVHMNTFRNVIDKGYGTPDSIQKIRENLLQDVAA